MGSLQWVQRRVEDALPARGTRTTLVIAGHHLFGFALGKEEIQARMMSLLVTPLLVASSASASSSSSGSRTWIATIFFPFSLGAALIISQTRLLCSANCTTHS